MQGETPTKAEVQAEFVKRNQSVQANVDAERDAKLAAKAQRGNGKTYRGAANRDITQEKEVITEAPSKALEPFVAACATSTHFFTTWHPDSVETALLDALRASDIEPKTHEKKYKVKFEVATPVQQ